METIEQYGDLAVFVKVADAGGFSVAARALGISTSQASRLVSRLEERLGARLLNRTTRRVALTEAGRNLHERASRALAELQDAQRATRDEPGALRGTLRITMPVNFGVRYVMPLVASFSVQHPGVRFELSLDDRRQDIIGEGFDIAVRAGSVPDSSLRARRLGCTSLFSVASPAYLARAGVPQHPSELGDHEVLVAGRDATATLLRFVRGDEEVAVRVTPRIFTGNVEALLPCVLAGLGIARLPDAICGDDLRAGRVVRVLAEWDARMGVYALSPPGPQTPPKVKAFLEHLVAGLSHEPWVGEPG